METETRTECANCVRAKEHAQKHKKGTQYVSCQGHRLVDSIKGRQDESCNPAHDQFTIVTMSPPLPGQIGGWVLIKNPRDAVCVKGGYLAVARVAVVREGEFVDRHDVVIARLASGMYDVLEDAPSIAAVAIAIATSGECINTHVNGDAVEHPEDDDVIMHSQRSSCDECEELAVVFQ